VHSEDRLAYDELFIGGKPVYLLSVFDGHGGWQVASFLEREIGPKLRDLASRQSSTDPTAIGDLLTKAYLELEEKLRGRVARSMQLGFDRFVRVGSCSITVSVTETHYTVANTGDCKALLCSGGEAVPLSRTHNANDPGERDRLCRDHPKEDDVVRCETAYQDVVTKELFVHPDGGRIPTLVNCYIKGVLQPSRTFGDFALKRADMNVDIASGAPVVKHALSMPYITAQPEILTVRRSAKDEMLVIGSDGLYDFLEDREIVEIARAQETPETAAQALVDEVRKRAKKDAGLTNSQYDALPDDMVRDVHDDITVLVFFLQYPKAWAEQWVELSRKLQDICDETAQSFPSLKEYAFSVCIADPSLQDCPLVAVSKGFEDLTGYSTLDALGRNCRFLSFGVPENLRDKETTERLKRYTEVATSGDPFSVVDLNVSPPRWAPSGAADGAAYFVRWNRRRDGGLFLNLFLLRQVWVGTKSYILALQTRLPDALVNDADKNQLANIEVLCREISRAILHRMTSIEDLLTPQHFALSSKLADSKTSEGEAH
jgi:serine/threonine protein phosphatase PrpC